MFDPIQIEDNRLGVGKRFPMGGGVDATEAVSIATGRYRGTLVGYIGYDQESAKYVFCNPGRIAAFSARDRAHVLMWAVGQAYGLAAGMLRLGEDE